VLPLSSPEYFRAIRTADDESYASSKMCLAIDLIGPGGGQWTLGLQPDGRLVCTAGVHREADSLLRLKVTEFYEMVSQSSGSHENHAVAQLFPLPFSEVPFTTRAPGQRESAY
jgi:hypothetical protein